LKYRYNPKQLNHQAEYRSVVPLQFKLITWLSINFGRIVPVLN